MKKRYLYLLLFGIPGFFVAGIVSVLFFGVTAGLLWIFVFGDNPWPAAVEKIIPVLMVGSFLMTWIVLMMIGFTAGRRLEGDLQLNKQHVLISSGLTLLFVILIALQQLRVGNLGPKSESVVCSDYCTLNDYSSSGMPPQNSGDRTCSCYDSLGKEALKVPMDSITPDASK